MSPNIDPRKKYVSPPFNKQEKQTQPGHLSAMNPVPDHGEQSYQGAGRLAGLKTLITGADSGIGRAVAIAFAREEADVAISYLPEEDKEAQITKKLIIQANRECVLLPADLREESNCKHIIAKTLSVFDSLDVLVLNAGTQHLRAENADIDSESIQEVFNTNLIAPILLMKAAAPNLKPGASVIITASIQSFNPSPDLLDYAITKAGLVALTEALAKEQTQKGVRVNAVAPGATWTPLIPATGWTSKVEHFGENYPLGRPAQPAELAGAYVFLASEEASFVSGAVLKVTGGKS